MVTTFTYRRSPTKEGQVFLWATALPSAEFISRYTPPAPDCIIDSTGIVPGWLGALVPCYYHHYYQWKPRELGPPHVSCIPRYTLLNVRFLNQPLTSSASLLKQRNQDRGKGGPEKGRSVWCDQSSCLHSFSFLTFYGALSGSNFRKGCPELHDLVVCRAKEDGMSTGK